MSQRNYAQELRQRQVHISESLSEEEKEFRRALDSVPPPSPPDGGWGWIIVFASFTINAIVDGLCYSFGIILPEFVYHLNHNSSMGSESSVMLPDHVLKLVDSNTQLYPTACISFGGALQLGVYMLSGPVASALCNRFGSRRVAVGGCILSFLSLFLTQFAQSAPMFLILFGVCSGIGFGMMFLAALVIVGFYFEKRRSQAATIAMCGSGVGMAAMAPLVSHLLDEFEWKGCLALISGVVLQGAVLATLYRPLDADLRRRKKMILRRLEEDKKIGPQTCLIMQRLLEEKRRQRTVSTGSMNNVIITRENELLRPEEFRERKPSIISRLKSAIGRSKENVASNQSSRATTPQVPHRHIDHRPVPNIKVNGVDTPPGTSSPLSGRQFKLSPTPSNLVKGGSNQGSVRSLQTGNSSAMQAEYSDRGYHSVQDFPMSDNISISTSVGACSVTPDSTENIVRMYKKYTPDSDRPMYRKDILYSGSVRNLPQYNNNMDDYLASITQVPEDSGGENPGVEHGCCWHRLGCLPKSVRDVLRSIFDTSTFSSPTYILLSIASFLTMLGYFIPFVFLPVYARSLGMQAENVALLLSAMGGANTLGRLLAGAIGGRKWVDALIVNNIALIIAGGLVIGLPYLTEPYLLVIFSVVFGLCVAAFSSLRSQIVVELVGLDMLTTTFGQLIILHGLAVIVGTPIAGLLYDLTGEFKYGFYMSGVSIAMSGLLCLPLRKLSQMEASRANQIPPSNDSSEEEVKKVILSSLSEECIEGCAESPF